MIRQMIQQMKKEQKKLRKNNDGLTLIELLVAVILLAIIIIPLLHSFVSAANVNRRAKISMRGTTVAENIMESMNALPLEEAAKNFHDVDSTIFPTPRITGHGEITTPVCVENGLFIGNPSNKYTFYLDGIQEDNQRYDALIEVDASGYRSAEDESDQYFGRLYNNGLSADIANYNSKRDVLVVQSDTENQGMAVLFLNNTGDVSKTLEEIQSKMSRKILAQIYDGEEEGTTEVKVTATFHCYDDKLDNTNNEYVKNYGIYTFKESSPLRNLFLGYIPNYDSKGSTKQDGKYLDQIEIDNQNQSEVRVSVIKQLSYTTTLPDDAKIYDAEKNYTMQIHMKEKVDQIPDMGTQDDNEKSKMSLRSNLGTNLGSNLTADSSDSDRLLALCPNQVKYSYEYVLSGGNGSTLTNVDDITNYCRIQSIEGDAGEKNAIYAVTVSVYTEGAHAEGYPEEDKITTLSNQ